MKVIEFIEHLKKLGYDENTELTFTCYNENTGQYHYLCFHDFDCDSFYKDVEFLEEYYGKPYINKDIDIELGFKEKEVK